MKVMRSLIFIFTVMAIIPACQKELAVDNIVTQATGTLLKTASGDCAPIILGGTYVQNTALGTSNYLEVQVNFSTTGTYEIQSDTLNGYSFKATGNAISGGIQTVRLLANGTPIATGTNVFTIRFNSSICTVNVVVSSAAAVYTFGNTSGACTGASVTGSYIVGVPLVPSNTVAIQVNVSTLGSYSINSNTVNGISFSSSGTFTNLGTQTVILVGSNTALAAGPFTFNTALTGGCTFVVTVTNPAGTLAQLTTIAASTITCTAALSGGNITSDGGATITARGICYGIAANPTTANSVVNSGGGIGVYSSNMTGLTAGTTYHVRAFATNSAGTAYGNDISFTTTTGCLANIFVTGWDDIYNIAGNIRTPKIWVNTSGTYSGTALPFTLNSGTEANAIFVSGTDVYVAGKDQSAATIWKNGVATNLGTIPSPPFFYTSSAYSVYVSGTDVYVAGFSQANLATVWKNGVATILNNSTMGTMANAIFVSGTDVYVGGYENQMISSTLVSVATIWKNGVATAISNGTANASVNSIFVSGSDVYATGKDGNVAKVWKNGVATSLPVTGTDKAVANSIFVSGTDVYVAGTEDDGTSLNSYAVLWKNGINTHLTTSNYRNGAQSVYVVGTDVYVAGALSNGGANTKAAVWKNGVAGALTSGSTDAVAYGIFVK
jgi:hypothetical protein